MRVVWDPVKAKQNLRKHGVRFSDAEGVLFDAHAISQEDVYTYRGDDIRLISARRATRRERHAYEEGI